jgi:hypothetical protein
MSNITMKFKIKRNSENLYRIEVDGRELRDEDFLIAIPSSFKSSPVTLSSEKQCHEKIAEYKKSLEMRKAFLAKIQYTPPVDDFKEMCQHDLTLHTDHKICPWCGVVG